MVSRNVLQTAFCYLAKQKGLFHLLAVLLNACFAEMCFTKQQSNIIISQNSEKNLSRRGDKEP
jgi:hypothetical protein